MGALLRDENFEKHFLNYSSIISSSGSNVLGRNCRSRFRQAI
jgi:hypothetical protein